MNKTKRIEELADKVINGEISQETAALTMVSEGITEEDLRKATDNQKPLKNAKNNTTKNKPKSSN